MFEEIGGVFRDGENALIVLMLISWIGGIITGAALMAAYYYGTSGFWF